MTTLKLKSKIFSLYGKGALAVFAVLALFAVSSSSAFAANNGNINYNVNIKPSMTVNIPSSSVALALNPSGTAFSSQALNITVGTNNPSGYTLYMSSKNGTSNLTNEDGSGSTIQTLPSNGTTGYTESTFVDDKWGISVGSGNYFPFVSGNSINSSSTAVNNHLTALNFAAKASYNQEPGTYSTDLNFSVLPKILTVDMQNLDPDLCTAEPAVVSDSRDGKLYTIARLADDQCWMVSDLNLAGGTVLSNDKSDVPSENYYTLPASSETGFDDDTKAFVYNSGNITTNQADCTSTQPCNSYYSWLAATAGNKTNVTGNGVDAPYSICPAGWRLPSSGNQSDSSATSTTGYKKGDFYKMLVAYGMNGNNYYANSSTSPTGATIYSAISSGTVPSFLLAGFYYGSSFGGGGSDGRYWSSSSLSSTNAYYLYFNSSNVTSAGNRNRRYGFPVRCVLREGPSIDDLTSMTMQDFGTSSDKDALIELMEDNTAYALKDARDGKYYNIAKLADGKVWMTTSLNLAGGTKLYSETSNVPSGYPESAGTGYYTLPSSSSSGFSSDTTAYVYNTGRENSPAHKVNDSTVPATTCTPSNNTSTGSCDSYYSWLAATAGNKTNVTGNGVDAPYSICPAGWRLPSSGNQSDSSATSTTGYKKGDFYKMLVAYGMNGNNYYANSSTSPTGATIYSAISSGTVPSFLLAGYYDDSSFNNGGSYGYYWSSSSGSSTLAYYLYFSSSRVNSANNYGRRRGFPVRCVLSES